MNTLTLTKETINALKEASKIPSQVDFWVTAMERKYKKAPFKENKREKKAYDEYQVKPEVEKPKIEEVKKVEESYEFDDTLEKLNNIELD